MKDVYEKNPQMGDPSSLQPKISETICNMERLRSEIHKNEVAAHTRISLNGLSFLFQSGRQGT